MSTPPVLMGRDRDLQVPADGRDVGSFGEQPVGPSEFADDLLRCVSPAFMKVTPCPHDGRREFHKWGSDFRGSGQGRPCLVGKLGLIALVPVRTK